jgi:protein-S-isoprenylcysteine O-methyltransferase Ste14
VSGDQSWAEYEKNALSAEQTTSCGNRAAGARLASIALSVRYDLLVPSSLALEVTGGALLLVGVSMRILTFKEIPSTYHIKGLVTSGVYTKTRNPICLGFIFMIVGVAVLLRGVLALIWAFTSVFVLYRIARSEESDLERIFGERYLLYKGSVPMFFPRFWEKK